MSPLYADTKTEVIEAAFHLTEVKSEAEDMGDDQWILENVRPLEREYEEAEGASEDLLERMTNLEYPG